MRIKCSLLGIAFSLAGVVPVIAENAYVTIQMNDGTKNSFLLASVPKISHSADSLKVEGDANALFLLNDVDFFNFSESDLTSVPVLQANELRVTYTDNQQVKIEGLEAGAQVWLYSASGVAIAQKSASADGVADFVLPQTPGVYFLKTNKQSVKLVKK